MIKQLINASAGSVKIDCYKIEKHLGFKLHNNVKDFYSRIVCDEKFGFRGKMKFVREKFIIPTGNDRYDTFLFNNRNTNDCDAQGNDAYYYLALLSSKDLKDLPGKFEQSFNMEIWRYIDNMGNRLYIGRLSHIADKKLKNRETEYLEIIKEALLLGWEKGLDFIEFVEPQYREEIN